MMVVWLCWLLPIIGTLLIPLLAKISHRLRNYAALAFCLLAAIAAASMLPEALAGRVVWHQVEWMPQFGVKAGILADPLSVFMANVVAWLSFLIAVYSLGYMHGEKGLTRYWALFNLFVGGMLLLVLSDNLLQMFIGWEIVGVCSYALIGFWYRDEKEHWVGSPPDDYPPSHAGMKAFLFTKVGDVCMLMAIFIIYHFAGTFGFVELSQDTGWMSRLSELRLLLPVALLLFGGPLGKSAQFPLHEWLPEAMAGPTPVSALIHAATMVKAGVYLVARVVPILLAGEHSSVATFFTVVAWVGGFTAFMAATQAVVQRELKKVLAYSTVSQLGYMFLALGVSGLASNLDSGYVAAVSHLLSHAIFKACLFLAAGSVIHACHTRFMDGMGGIRKAMPITFGCMLVAAFSLSGVPPLSGFWSKDAILHACLEARQYALFGLAAITAGLTFFYSLRMIALTFLGARHDHRGEARLDRSETIHSGSSSRSTLHQHGHAANPLRTEAHEVSPIMWLPCVVLAMATVALGIANPIFARAFQGYFEPVYGAPAHVLHDSVGAERIAVVTSLTMLLLSGFAGWYLYVARKANLAQFVQKHRVLRAIRAFLWNRWYINAFYYKLARHLIAFSKATSQRLETGGIDRLQHRAAGGATELSRLGFEHLEAGLFDRLQYEVADGVTKTSRRAFKRLEVGVIDRLQYRLAKGLVAFGQKLRKSQTGVLSYNMLYVQVGLLIVLVAFVGAMLWAW